MTNVSAKIIADSLFNGVRLTSIQLEYHRFILPELNTHRVFSRSTASSRAIPTAKLIERVRTDAAMPVFWGKNQSGMVADNALPDDAVAQCEAIWQETALFCAQQAERLHAIGLHKQTANRLIEPFLWASTIITATEWDNFFNLRLAHDAQPEIRELAEAMMHAMDTSIPVKRSYHLPYITEEVGSFEDYLFYAPISAARCARVSYLNHDQTQPDIQSDLALAERLIAANHQSPQEHQAWGARLPLMVYQESNERFFGNIRGWVQYRKYLENQRAIG